MYAFISYNTEDKNIARKIKTILDSEDIPSFLAHEDIHLSEEWQNIIINEMEKSDIFISILSENYHKSFWCIQESGIAAFRKDMTEIPLSIDKTVPQGFSSKIQSKSVSTDSLLIYDLIPGLVKHDINYGIKRLDTSGSFYFSEVIFEALWKYIDNFTDEQIQIIFRSVISNGQVSGAYGINRNYLPKLLEIKSYLLHPDDKTYLENICKQNAVA